MLEPKWIKAEDLPADEKVYLKKDFIGWRVVEPWKNEDGSINWFVLITGGKRNLFILAFIIIIALGFYFGIREYLSSVYAIVDQLKLILPYCHLDEVGQAAWNNLSTLNLSSLL